MRAMSTNDARGTKPTASTPAYVTLLSGSVAAVGSTFAKQPMDRLKWLRQVSERQSAINQSTYWNVTKSIAKNEGFFGFFRGVSAAISRNIPHAALIYTLFPRVRSELSTLCPNMNRSLINTVSGSIASIVVTCITHPGDTLRVRFTVQYSSLIYSSYPQLCKSMLKEGIGSFYRGLFVSCVGTTLRGGIGFGVYETLKSEDIKKWSVSHPVFDRLSIGFIAGGTSTFLSYPVDTIRRRMQVWGTGRHLTQGETDNFGKITSDHIKNARSLTVHILKTEGMSGFFKGFAVTMIKTPIATAVSLTLNDIAKKLVFDINA